MNSSAVPAVVIITRPSGAGERLYDRVVERGHRAIWWPAFDIAAAPDFAAASAALARLTDYDLAIFVSVNAVRAVQPLLSGGWPVNTVIGAVGASTRAAVESELSPDARAALIAPDDDSEGGSEAFWAAWQATGRRAERVLLLRAEEGRDWLAERFVESGARVDAVAVYARRPLQLPAEEVAQLRAWIAADAPPVIVFSSSEAIAALDGQVGSEGSTWLRAGIAIASHARIAQQLVASGYSRVLNATFDDDSIIAKLESMGGKR